MTYVFLSRPSTGGEKNITNIYFTKIGYFLKKNLKMVKIHQKMSRKVFFLGLFTWDHPQEGLSNRIIPLAMQVAPAKVVPA